LIGKLASKGINIVAADFQNFSDVRISDKLDQKKCAVEVFEILRDACILFYGIYAASIPEIVLDKAVSEIRKKFFQLTIQELKYCFERIEIERRVTITVADLLSPIQRYVSAQEFKNREISKIQDEEMKKQEGLILAQEFINENLKKYQECLIQSTEFTERIRAINLVRNSNLASKIEDPLKSILWNESKIELEKIRESMECDASLIFQYTDLNRENKDARKHIYALKLVNECLKRKIEIELINTKTQ